MRVTLEICKCIALLALTVLCVAVTVNVVSISHQAQSTIYKIDGEIDELHRLTLEAGLTAMEARKASAKESAYLDQWNSQIANTMDSVSRVMSQTVITVASIQDTAQAATGTLQTAQGTIQALQAPITQATSTLQAAQRTTEDLQPVIGHLDALVTDPAIAATLANVQGTTAHLDATAADVQAEVYKYTHPGIWAKIKGITLDIAHVFNPL